MRRILKTPFIFSLLTILFFLGGCQSYQPQVGLTRDPRADFSEYSSFSLSTPPLGEIVSTDIETTLRETLREELLARGLREVGPNRADLLVSRRISTENVGSSSHYSGGPYGVSSSAPSLWPYGYGRGRSAMVGAPRVYTEMESLQKGSLMVTFYDRQLQRPVLVAVAKDVIGTDKQSPARVRLAIQEMVRGLPLR